MVGDLVGAVTRLVGLFVLFSAWGGFWGAWFGREGEDGEGMVWWGLKVLVLSMCGAVV